VRGTDIKVSQIAHEAEHHGMTAEDILEAHPHLTRADVDAALGYYSEHRDAILQDWEATERLIAAVQAQYPGR
jgi:uncharacterized protein (DUF433 family)